MDSRNVAHENISTLWLWIKCNCPSQQSMAWASSCVWIAWLPILYCGWWDGEWQNNYLINTIRIYSRVRCSVAYLVIALIFWQIPNEQQQHHNQPRMEGVVKVGCLLIVKGYPLIHSYSNDCSISLRKNGLRGKGVWGLLGEQHPPANHEIFIIHHHHQHSSSSRVNVILDCKDERRIKPKKKKRNQ